MSDGANRPVTAPPRTLPETSVIGTPPGAPPADYNRPGDWRDPVAFGRLDREIEEQERQHSGKRDAGRNRKPLSAARTKELQTVIRKHAGPISAFIRKNCAVQLRYRPKALKAVVIGLFGKEIPPLPRRPGRPPDPIVTKALRMKQRQQRTRKRARKLIDWDAIALKYIKGFCEMNDRERKRVRNRLRNSVCAREGRENRKRRGPRR
jgi:hypothetical protein